MIQTRGNTIGDIFSLKCFFFSFGKFSKLIKSHQKQTTMAPTTTKFKCMREKKMCFFFFNLNLNFITENHGKHVFVN